MPILLQDVSVQYKGRAVDLFDKKLNGCDTLTLANIGILFAPKSLDPTVQVPSTVRTSLLKER